MNGKGTGVGVRAIIVMATAFLLCGLANTRAQVAPKTIPIPLPPMGWSSWNSFSNTVDSQVIVDQAKAMISTGMSKAGYKYINIDEGWWLGERDEKGNIVVDPKAWPALAPGEQAGDMSNIVRYIHGLGLKAGIYTDAGMDGCGTFSPDLGPGYPGEGSEGYYQQDFLQFARWGFDYVKVDWCGGYKENLDPAVQYAEIARAIARAESITGHRLYYSICNWGKQSPWTWAPNVGGVRADIWRTSGDIVDPIVANSKNAGRKATFKKVLSNFDEGIHPEAQHTGFYNDPDMMVIGMPGLTDAENRAHMSLWAISGAPLLVGADLTKLSEATLATLTNSAVLAIDQDPLGLQAVEVHRDASSLEVWSKRLSKPGERAVLLLNRTDSAGPVVVSPITVHWRDLGLAGGSSSVRDPWTGKDLGVFDDHYTVPVQRGDAVLLIVQGTDRGWTPILPAANSKTGRVTESREEQRFNFDSSPCDPSVAAAQIVYRNPDTSSRFAEVRANEQLPKRIAFPPTGVDSGRVWIQIGLPIWVRGTFPGPTLPKGTERAKNTWTFSPVGGDARKVESILLQLDASCGASPEQALSNR
jgi:hypothetical protein